VTATGTTRLVAGVYPLLLAFMAGCVFVDQLRGRLAATGDADAAPHAVADVLLVLTIPVLALGALAATLGEGRSRALFALSLAVFSLEFLLPALVDLLPGGAWLTQTGPLLRGAVVLGALGLACLGQREVLR
jgi:hypothetical protein